MYNVHKYNYNFHSPSVLYLATQHQGTEVSHLHGLQTHKLYFSFDGLFNLSPPTTETYYYSPGFLTKEEG